MSLANDQVSFSYTDARTRQRHTCTLDALAFIDRSLCVQHVLPKGFCKVRYARTELVEVTAASEPHAAHHPAGGAPLVRPDDRARRNRRTGRDGCATARQHTLPPVPATHGGGGNVAPDGTLSAAHSRDLNRSRRLTTPDAAT